MISAVFCVWSLIAVTLCYKTPVFTDDYAIESLINELLQVTTGYTTVGLYGIEDIEYTVKYCNWSWLEPLIV